ncbi:Uncharacterized protein HDE_14160 [Halotydeus destructor]|nr:Uncharacterized protein HDE_14160 [Halotydeus destructor]
MSAGWFTSLALLAAMTVAHANQAAHGCWLGPPQSFPPQAQAARQQQPALAPAISKTNPSSSRVNNDEGRWTTVLPQVQPGSRPASRVPFRNQRFGFSNQQPSKTSPRDLVRNAPAEQPEPIEQVTESPESPFLAPETFQQIFRPNPNPYYPVYDRSELRFEPKHPSFVGDDSSRYRQENAAPTLAPWARSTEAPTTTTTTTTARPYYEPITERPVRDQVNRKAPRNPTNTGRFQPRPQGTRGDIPVTTSTYDDYELSPVVTVFYDPTRRPKSKTNVRANYDQPTTRTPNNKPPLAVQRAMTTTESPAESTQQREFAPPRPGIGNRGQLDPARLAPPARSLQIKDEPTGSEGPNAVAQPDTGLQAIDKILDMPDLDVDGKPVTFAILKDALYRVNLLEVISRTSSITLFAPTDEAFLSLPADKLEKLQRDPQYLRSVLLRHVIDFDVNPDQLKNNAIIPSYSGEQLIVNVIMNGKLTLVRGTPIIAGTTARNGVIYVINKVLLD